MASENLFAEPLDLDAYLARIEYTGDRHPSAAVLAAIHEAHATHIPFENFDALLGRGVRLDLPSLQAKLIHARRGGYCFEQNLLLGAALQSLGFDVVPLAARVRYGAHHVLPRTHMLLLVKTEQESWLADVGFGAEGLLQPVPFVADQPATQYAWTYRLVREGAHWVLQSLRNDAWLDLYTFSVEPQQWIDYHVANYYVATHPDSPFTRMLTVQRTSSEARYILRNYDFIIDRGAEAETCRLASDAELRELLVQTFGLHLPVDVELRLAGPGDDLS